MIRLKLSFLNIINDQIKELSFLNVIKTNKVT